MKTSDQTNEIAAALAKAQGELKPAIKDATNPAYRSKYADLAANWEAWRAVGPSNGLALVQEPVKTDQGVRVTTRLMHTSGQWIEFEPLEIPLAKHDAHGVGSGVSYGKRYSMGGACGIVAEDDDDGNGAVGGESGPPRWTPRRDFSKGPTHGPAAVMAGAPKPPATAEESAANAEEAARLFPTAEEDERGALVSEITRLAKKLKLKDEQKNDYRKTYLGGSDPLDTSIDLTALRDLTDALLARAGEPKRKAS
jgi:hypothetical protein